MQTKFELVEKKKFKKATVFTVKGKPGVAVVEATSTQVLV